MQDVHQNGVGPHGDEHDCDPERSEGSPGGCHELANGIRHRSERVRGRAPAGLGTTGAKGLLVERNPNRTRQRELESL
jgi:hypothetical protein